MKTTKISNWTFYSKKASNPLLHKHYRNRLPIHCSSERTIKMAEDITNNHFHIYEDKFYEKTGGTELFVPSEVILKDMEDMAHVLLAFVQQRKTL